MTAKRSDPHGRAVRRRSLLVFSQVYVPDPASVGQHMADVAANMAARGFRVTVIASARGYENPDTKYPSREIIDGVEIRRLPFASFGKKSMFLRVLGTASFQLQCLLVGLFKPNVDGIFFSTSPPLVGIIATLIHILRGVPIAYWAMDLNPDQLIAMGQIRKRGITAHILEAVNRMILRESSLVVTLDRFMAGRIEQRVRLGRRLLVMPPWPHEDHMGVPDATAQLTNPFRVRHGLEGKFVIMYSGNHSPSNPLTTLLRAAEQLRDDPNLRFVFVGGGSGKREVESAIRERGLSNTMSLPYQPLSELKHSLSAAEVHVVSLGDAMIGIIHPCKIYGAMSVGRPVLYFGPRPSHVMDLLDAHGFGLHVNHGDVDGAVRSIRNLERKTAAERAALGEMAKVVLQRTLSQAFLSKKFCDALEDALSSDTASRQS